MRAPQPRDLRALLLLRRSQTVIIEISPTHPDPPGKTAGTLSGFMLIATNLSGSSPGFAHLASLPGLRDFGGIPCGIAAVGRGVEYGLEEDSALPPRHLTRDRDLVAELRRLTNETKSLLEENARLREDMKSYRKENARLRQEIKSLRDELAALADRLKSPAEGPVEGDSPRNIGYRTRKS